MVVAVAGQAAVASLELLVHEADREVGEVAARELLAAGIAGRRVAGWDRGRRAGQHVAAVVADEDALLPGPLRERVLPVVDALLQAEEGVGRTLAEQHRDVQPAALRDVPARSVPLEVAAHVDAARSGSVGPVAGRRTLRESLDDLGLECVGRPRRGAEQRRPLCARDALRAEALVQVVPRDLRGERVVDRLAVAPQLLERPEELEAAAVGAAHGAESRVARPVLLHPAQSGHHPDQPEVVAALVARVLDVGEAAGLTEAALVERQHAVARVEPRLEAGRVGRA